MRALLVEDDPMIGRAVAHALRDAAYAVDWVMDGETAVESSESETYDIVLLDLGIPRLDGLSVLQQFRKRLTMLPVIVITAHDDVEDRIRGLDLGADDFIVKPFDVRELLARIRAVTRRQASGSPAILTNGIVSLDPATHQARTTKGACDLTAREFALLQALLARPGTILSREDLEGHIYGWNEEVESNAVEFLIHTVRRKLGTEVIRNVRGVGWMVARDSS